MTDSHDRAADAVADAGRDSRSRAGAAPRRPSAGVAVVRRAGPPQRGPGGHRQATVDTGCRTDRYRWKSPPAPAARGCAPRVRRRPEAADARRRERRGPGACHQSVT